MLADNITEKLKNESPHKGRVHRVLAHSYLFYFIVFLFALMLDFVFPLKAFEKLNAAPLGVLFLVFGTILISWAQLSSHKLKKENMTKETFCGGPYCYTRTPTHIGLLILMLGLGFIINSLFIIIFAIVFFVVTKLSFIRKEEKILAEKYGEPYLEYKKSVKF